MFRNTAVALCESVKYSAYLSISRAFAIWFVCTHSGYTASDQILDWPFNKNNTKHKQNRNISGHESVVYAHFIHVILMYRTSTCTDQEIFLSTHILMVQTTVGTFHFWKMKFYVTTHQFIFSNSKLSKAAYHYHAHHPVCFLFCLLALTVHSPQILEWSIVAVNSIFTSVISDIELLFLWVVNGNHYVQAEVIPNDVLQKKRVIHSFA